MAIRLARGGRHRRKAERPVRHMHAARLPPCSPRGSTRTGATCAAARQPAVKTAGNAEETRAPPAGEGGKRRPDEVNGEGRQHHSVYCVWGDEKDCATARLLHRGNMYRIYPANPDACRRASDRPLFMHDGTKENLPQAVPRQTARKKDVPCRRSPPGAAHRWDGLAGGPAPRCTFAGGGACRPRRCGRGRRRARPAMPHAEGVPPPGPDQRLSRCPKPAGAGVCPRQCLAGSLRSSAR